MAFAAPAMVLLSFVLAYYLGGVSYFLPALAGLWLVVLAGLVLILERTGYSRNFQSWDFPLRRTIIIPVGFLIALGFFVLLIYLLRLTA
jgi:hypothetical protein